MQSPTDAPPSEHRSRRELLTVAGSSILATISGCMGSDSDGDNSTPESDGVETTTATPGETTTATPGQTSTATPEETTTVAETQTATETSSTSSTPSSEETTTSTVAQQLDTHVTPMDTVDPMAPLDDLEFLSEILADRNVVGLGESTHGTREFFELKHRIVRYMVEEMGLRVFTWEAHFSESLNIDQYIRTGEGNPVDALDSIDFWTWDTKSVLDMIQWMRSYNEGKPEDEKIRFYGFDMQSAAGPAKAIEEYIRPVHPEFVANYQDTFSMIRAEGLDSRMTQEDQLSENIEATESFIPAVEEHLQTHEADYVSETSRSAWQLANRHLRVLQQNLAVVNPETEIPLARDKFMAENTEWIRNYESVEQVVAWGHNYHIGKTLHHGGSGSTMGGHLDEKLGDAYYALGMEFGKGSYQARGQKRYFTVDSPPEGTVPGLLSGLGEAQLFLDLEAAAADSDLEPWIETPQPMHQIGALGESDVTETLNRFLLAEKFDGLTFVEESTATKPPDGL